MIEELDDYQVDEETILLPPLLYRSFCCSVRSTVDSFDFQSFLSRRQLSLVIIWSSVYACVCVFLLPRLYVHSFACLASSNAGPVAPMGISAGS